MKVVEIDRSHRPQVNAFLHLPFKLYQHTPQWVPPLQPTERRRFRDDFAFYQHSEAAFFIVKDGKAETVGRIAVMNHRPHNEYRGRRDALLYLYEAADDDEVAAALFEAAETWALRQGLDRMVGPKGFLSGDGLGLLVEGFNYRPAMGIPYNPPYYVQQWEQVGGFAKEIDYYSARASAEGFEFPERIARLGELMQQRRGFHVPVFRTKAELRRHIPALVQAYNSAFADVWAYTPIPPCDVEAILAQVVTLCDPALMKVIFKDNEVAGFTFAYPDISAALQRTCGELYPFGWIDLLLEQRCTTEINVNGNAVLPKYQGLGANAVLYNELLKSLLSSRYQVADLVQVQENNMRMLDDLAEILPVHIHKRHRVYSKPLS